MKTLSILCFSFNLFIANSLVAKSVNPVLVELIAVSELKVAEIEKIDEDTYAFEHKIELSDEYAAVIKKRLLLETEVVAFLEISVDKVTVKYIPNSSYEDRLAFMKKATKVFQFDTLKLKENE